jgi:hypothetical protein
MMKTSCIKLAVFGLTVSIALSSAAAPLITEQEAQLPNAPSTSNTRGISRGPGVKIVSPEPGVQHRGPFDLRVEFQPRGGSKIDKSSVRVTYLKSPAIDLTPRVAASLSDSGIALKGAEIPAGEHAIRITVKDTDGREASATATLIGHR